MSLNVIVAWLIIFFMTLWWLGQRDKKPRRYIDLKWPWSK